ncbi:translation initiation factor 6 [Nematocida parisii]|uniref:Eukaryotic translation initiation factor 6 n=1 Tax=Nematocida parisii (strain ERTm3) TaxID=935791 RepID=I3EJC7_NEMP3|nr:eukaryotic translation initiation factor 6 [Nematocida parisii ERTm1]EIJ89324.1 eukaryotic translation initiation factor 6 [Nematocida parisii ERTm3]KAI5131264.1 translation initiation factor 6 [Nematocida parisii]KAI5167599.1 translation initiation factor 6 [Nematocida sp. AWRm79]KAI5185847.1 translation initiation factor 6 [Nematocida sp. AWRm78]EIJ94475.1 eukaryotic translation initiation factor 6 [Nematocida parisii ERTm1]|eukprot:XP_013058971.1 eukaryotic translation initiation factor 6 [Nematocida parisii ERTm1]
MSQRISFESSQEIGTFVRLTNMYALVAATDNTSFVSAFEEALNIPVIQTTINGIRMTGTQSIGNSRGLLVSSSTTDQELQHIRNSLPDKIRVRRIEERLNALGNIILANDNSALIHPDVSPETVELVSDVLGVDLFKYALAENGLVGSYAVMNNTSMLVSSKTTPEEVSELSDLLNVKVLPGTVNKGSDVIGSGVLINDFACFVGSKTTSTEIVVIDGLFKTTPTAVLGDDEKRAWIDALHT